MSRPPTPIAGTLFVLTLVVTSLALAVAGCAPNNLLRSGAEEAACPAAAATGEILKEPADRQKACRQTFVEVGCPPVDAKGKIVENDDLRRRWDRCRDLESRWRYNLVVLELDDQGRFRKEAQLDKLFEILERDIAKRPSGGVSLVVFVHGWRHNAEPDDSNLNFARAVLEGTVVVENQPPQYTRDEQPRSVVGVYVGWRGKSLTGLFGALELPTFWDRKFTAERVATGSVRELFARLKYFRDLHNSVGSLPSDRKEACVRDLPGPTRDKKTATLLCPAVRFFVVGHSFGGLLVYNALSESLIRSLAEAPYRQGKEDVVGEYADLVVLINPAIEGARFEPLHQAALRRQYMARQLPIFVSVTATNDWATKWAFLAGRWMNTVFESEAPGVGESSDQADRDHATRIAHEEREANIHAMGHIDRYKTHVLCPAETCPLTEWGAKSERRQLLTDWPKVRDNANCAAALQEQLSKHYLCRDGQCPDGVGVDGLTWDKGTDADGRIVRYREFLDSKGLGMTLTTHRALDERIKSTITRDGQPNATLAFSPVWMVESNDARIVNGHNGFDLPPLREFLVQLYHDRVMYGRFPDKLVQAPDHCR